MTAAADRGLEEKCKLKLVDGGISADKRDIQAKRGNGNCCIDESRSGEP
jgi:hypothetical protein